MKIIEASSDRLILQIQRYKVKFLDFSNNLDEMVGCLFFPIMLSILWYQSESIAEIKNTLIIAFVVVFITISGGMLYLRLHQKDNFYETDLYIFDRAKDFLSVKSKSILGSKQQQIGSLSDISSIYLEVFSETVPKEPTPEHPPTQLKTSYRVKLRYVTGLDMTLEYNSISAFSSTEVQIAFRGLIMQTEDTIKEVLSLLEIS